MTPAWWGREATAADGPRTVRGARGPVPELVASDPARVRAALSARIGAFTPEWTRLQRDDAGVALVRLYGFEVDPVLRRVNRLPEKLVVEYLRTAGVTPLAATPAETLLQFTVAPAAERAPLIPEGSQYAAPPATGEGDLVTFETVADVLGTSATLAELIVQEGGLLTEVKVPEPGGSTSFQPFGRRAATGRAFWIGLSADGVVGRSVSLGINVAAPAGAPPPAASGGLSGVPPVAGALLRWEVLGAAGAQPAEVLRDETGGLIRSGVIELGVPPAWPALRPAVLPDGEPRRWVRVRIVHGRFAAPPAFGGLFLNAARAEARRTIRNEVLEPVGVPPASGRQTMLLAQTPVIPGTVIIEVDEGVAADVFGVSTEEAAPASTIRRWSEVDDLSAASADDRVFTVDPLTGEVTFGDGVNGMRVPEGFRNVVAVRYRVGGGAAGGVDADEVTTMLTSVPFVTGVSNPVPATGGTDMEATERVVRRGPKEVRSRGRAVTVADYELLAERAPGARIARAHALAGVHPAHPGRRLPGVVAVLVVPHDRGEGPPTPDEGALRAVSRYLAARVAPAGVEVVTAAPRYHRVQTEAQVVVDAAADPGAVVRTVAGALEEYLHPISGGDTGEGWPFGGPIRYVPLVQRVLGSDPAVRAVPRLDLIVDGVRVPPCTDRVLSPSSLPWPETHEVVAVVENAA
jgi:predicted phage baseplate assembly protein